MLPKAMQGDRHRGEIARNLLTVRAMREACFPSELFDEHAWTILLHLFHALVDNEKVSEEDLIHRANVSTNAGRRWLAHLVDDGQIESREDGDDVAMTATATAAMRAFLDKAETVHRYRQTSDE